MKNHCLRHLITLLGLLAVGLLAACSSPFASPPAGKETDGGWLAMARGQVDVEGGLVRVGAARSGRVLAVAVKDGDSVSAGDLLAELDPREAQVGVGIAEASLRQAEADLEVVRARLPQARRRAERLDAAAAAGATSGQSAEDAGTALAVLQAQVSAAEAARGLAQQRLEEARLELDARSLRAPLAGRVLRRAVHVGDWVDARSEPPLFELLPERPRIVRAELGEAYVDLVRPGMRARVTRDSDQGAAVAARVLRVGEVFGPSRLTDDPVERAGSRDVECVLELEGGDFRIGQRVLVRFLPERDGTGALP